MVTCVNGPDSLALPGPVPIALHKLPSRAECTFPPVNSSSALCLVLDNGMMQIDHVSVLT